jgi:hypothetical protein
MVCGRPTYDPDKKEPPWTRGVSEGRQVLVCPKCQIERDDWKDKLERCARCSSTRLSLMLDEVVCRQCGRVAGSDTGA